MTIFLQDLWCESAYSIIIHSRLFDSYSNHLYHFIMYTFCFSIYLTTKTRKCCHYKLGSMRICISGSPNLTPFISVPYKIAKADFFAFCSPRETLSRDFFGFFDP